MGFTKLDAGILDSSIWEEDIATRVLWISMLAKADRDGFVSCSHNSLYRIANMSKEDCERAIAVLEGPDKSSRSPEFDGKRVGRVDGGWTIFNYKKYRDREYDERRKEIQRIASQRYRDKLKSVNKKDDAELTAVDCSASASESVSSLKEEECEKEITKEKKEKPLWKLNFGEYELQAGQAFDRLVADQEFLRLRKKYHPNLDIRLSMEKAFNDFWGQECGWKHKKAQRADEIDWERTYANALTMKGNQVYEKRD